MDYKNQDVSSGNTLSFEKKPFDKLDKKMGLVLKFVTLAQE